MRSRAAFVTLVFVVLFVAGKSTARAEDWPTLEEYVKKCVLIVKCRADKDNRQKYEVLESWIGNYRPDLFAPQPPDGCLLANDSHGNVNPVAGREVIFFYTKQNQPDSGKLQFHSTAFPINNGKIIYASTNENLRKEYTVDDFKVAVLTIRIRQALIDSGIPADRVAKMSVEEMQQEIVKQYRQANPDPREKWTYAELSKQADVIVVATCMSSTDFPFEKSKFQFPGNANRFDGFSSPYDVGVASKLKVLAVLRGEVKGEQIEVLHLRYGPNVVNLSDVAFAEFEKIVRTPAMISAVIEGQPRTESPGERIAVVPEYLVFLKRRDDGRFEAVSGQTHSAYSVRTLNGSRWLSVQRFKPVNK